MRLAPEHERPIDQLQTLHTVRASAREQRLQAGDLVCPLRDDDLSAVAMRYTVTGAEVVHQMTAVGAEPCFQRAKGVVDAGVDDAAVVGAGVEAGAGVTFNEAGRSPTHGQRARRGETGDAGADHGDIDRFHCAVQLRKRILPSWYN